MLAVKVLAVAAGTLGVVWTLGGLAFMAAVAYASALDRDDAS